MTPFLSLLLPIVLASVAVFVVSTAVHMVMPWHKHDYANVPDDDAAMAAVRALQLAPGDYAVPNPRLADGAKNPEFIAKFEAGPAFHMTVMDPGKMNMGRYMGTWFLFTLLIATIAGWVTGTIVPPGGSRHAAFHYGAIVTLCSYTFGSWPLSIWYHRRWSHALKDLLDGVLYGLATGAVFMWMWPKG